MAVINNNIHYVDPESIIVSIRKYEDFITVKISCNFDDGNGPLGAEHTLFIDGVKGANGIHDAMVTLKSVFPNAVVEGAR